MMNNLLLVLYTNCVISSANSVVANPTAFKGFIYPESGQPFCFAIVAVESADSTTLVLLVATTVNTAAGEISCIAN